MAWTTPKTFTDGYALTATDLNIYVRDNMLELNAAKASTAGVNSYFITDAPNSQIPRLYDTDAITTLQSRTSSDYGDLASLGPTCTVTCGTTCLVLLSCQMNIEADNTSARMSFEVSGATEIAATDNYAICMMTNDGAGGAPTFPMQFSQYTWVDNLTPGVNTFTAKYRVGVQGSTANFQVRRLLVFPWS